jgi:mercuric ion transport protein
MTIDIGPLAPLAAPDKTRRWSIAANAGAIVSAFVASACCVGPLVFALLGLGGGALLVKFEPYRPYFMALTLALLGAGFYFTYRKPKAVSSIAEGDACGCPAPRTNRAGRIMLWVATALVVGFLAFPYIAPLLFS